MHIDDLLKKYIGEYGRYQIWLIFFIGIEEIFMSAQTLSAVFTAGEPEHFCSTSVLKEPSINCSQTDLLPFIYPNDGDTYSKCSMYNRNYGSLAGNSTQTTYSTQTSISCLEFNETFPLDGDPEVIGCESWAYDRTLYRSTIVTEWDLVCTRAWMIGTISSIFFAGRSVGNLISGVLADKFGRKKVLMVSTLLGIILAAASSASPSYTVYAVLRFFIALCGTAKSNTGFVYANEFIGPKRRAVAGATFLGIWSVGGILLAGAAYIIRDWRWLQLAITLPETVYLVAIFFLAPESPRWDLTVGNVDAAKATLKKVADHNKTELPEKYELTQDENGTEMKTWIDLFRTPGIRFLSITMCYVWASNGFAYYGLSLNTSNLGGDPFINFFVSAAVELPAIVYTSYIFNKFGRVWSFSMSQLAGALMLLSTVPVPSHLNWLIITLAMIGKFFVAASFNMCWMYSQEMFPTCIRSVGICTTSMFARISSIVASYVYLLSKVHRALPLVIFGVLQLVAALLSLLLPETNGQKLPQDIHEGEILVKEHSRICLQSCACFTPKKEEVYEECNQNDKEMGPIQA